MTNEEAADVLKGRGFLNDQGDFEEACDLGAAALRRLDELERWCRAWIATYQEDIDYAAGKPIDFLDHWARHDQKFFKEFLKVLNGNIEWPETPQERG